MKICLLGDFSGNPDEGMKNISRTIRDMLSLKHNVLTLNSRDVFKKAFLYNLRAFRPEIIHYLHGPTIRSLIILKSAKIFSGNKSMIVVSATKPYFSKYNRWAIPLFKPDLILSQSKKIEIFFRKINCRVKFLPNGVNCQCFRPASASGKIGIRKKLGFSLNKKIILHVGHIKINRNLSVFKEIQKIEDVQVVVVGSITETASEELKKDLQKAEIKVFNQFYDDISQFYKMADLYIFPLSDSGNKLPVSYNEVGAIDLPLSVLEAMACNLPVITTRFGALPRLFHQGDGLYYEEDEKGIIAKVTSFSYENLCRTREMVLPYDWEQIVGSIESEYHQLLH